MLTQLGAVQVKRLREEAELQRREAEAALRIQTAFRRLRTNRRIAERRAAMDEEIRRQEATANALDSLRRMGVRGDAPADQVAALLAEDPSLTEAEAAVQIHAAMKLQCRFRCRQAAKRVEALRKQREREIAEVRGGVL